MRPESPWTNIMETPLGPIGMVIDENCRLTRLSFIDRTTMTLDQCESLSSAPAFRFVQRQLDAYFQGTCHTFNVPLFLQGTPFQIRVWQEIANIPFAHTITYSELAARMGNPNLTSSIGHAAAQNPVKIIVPCHRLVSSAGVQQMNRDAVERGKALLAMERGERLLGGILAENQ